MPASSRKALRAISYALLAISVIWAIAWVLAGLASGDWFPGMFWLALVLVILTILAGAGLILVTVAHIMVLLCTRQLSLSAFLPIIVVIVGAYFLWGKIPTRSAVTFYLHRDEFVVLAETAQAARQPQYFDFPPSSFYRDAHILRCASKSFEIEFLIGSFYLPLVFVSTDRPEDVYDTCSAGGFPVEKLDPCWYVCKRDWN